MLFLFVPVLLLAGCSSGGNANADVFPLVSERGSAVPFSTAEPESYRADVVVKAGDIERRFFVARDGERRRIDYDSDGPRRKTVLKTDRGYLLDFGRKVFAVLQTGEAGIYQDDFVLHTLNQQHYTEFEDAGSEDGLDVYRAVIDGSPASEITIRIDPTTNLPIKQEFFSIEGERRELMYTIELQNVSLEVESGAFELPAGFREVSLSEFRKRTR